MRMVGLKHSRSLRFIGLALALTFCFSIGMPSSESWAASKGNPFFALKGWWKGPGTISLSKGVKEKIICRVTYKLSKGGTIIAQQINCAGTDYRFSAFGDLIYRRGRLSGSFREEKYNVRGKLSGTARRNGFRVRFTSDQFRGQVSVRLRGARRHSLTISQYDAETTRYIPRVSIALRR